MTGADKGTTLLELLLALTVLLLLSAISAGAVVRLRSAAAVRSARLDLVAAADRSRMAAQTLGGPASLELVGGRWRVAIRAASGDTAVWQGRGPAAEGVAISGFSTPLVFDRSGLATGVANRTVRLTKNGYELTVVISRLGRIR